MAVALLISLAALPGRAATYNVNPTTYQAVVAALMPGDTVNFAAGTYRPLNISGLNGTAAARITLQGPTSGPPAIITVNPANPDCCNVVQLGNTSYVTVRNLTVDSALVLFVDGLKASTVTHDIEVIDCNFLGQGSHQETVAISTKATAWNWVIRGNVITEAGTGLYLGNSDGNAPFINGIIENNFIVDTIGYNGQIKFQLPYAQPAGLGAGPHRTLIRNNVFFKTRPQSSWPAGIVVGARPNLLVGGFPSSGFGMNDFYEIYGNFFFQNFDGEPLLQGSGRVAAHDNVFVGGNYRAISFRDHDLPIRRAYAYHNTIFGPPNGITVSGDSLEDSRVSGNLIFAGTGVTAPVQMDNLVDTVANAANYVNMPSLTPGAMDFYPRAGMATGAAIDMTPYLAHAQYNADFNGTSKGAFTFRGAYAGTGINPGWALARAKKSLDPAADPDGDGVPNGVEGPEGLSPFVKDNDVFASNRLFAMQQYRDFLGREGDAGGITGWVNFLNGGGTRAAVTEGFFGSNEFQGTGSPVVRLYFAYFLRIPDYGGLTFWMNYFRTGHSLVEISNAFAGSQEFVDRYGALTNSAFVDLVYQNVLGRPADAGGKAFWLGQLNGGMTRGEMMTGFSESAEYQATILSETYVTMMYVGMLKRAPDQGGFTFWTGYLDGGNSGQALINGFLVAPEYRNRFL